jgi:hypothetical protein
MLFQHRYRFAESGGKGGQRLLSYGPGIQNIEVGTGCDCDLVLIDLTHLIYASQDGSTALADPLLNGPNNPAPHPDGWREVMGYRRRQRRTAPMIHRTRHGLSD